ncbi:hypothetical protein, partial [Actibacterium sp.]|uniref:hypothetical protein n=1 Tax=Actibacterium sp. TaxID=1872125 RepID=UPI0035622559
MFSRIRKGAALLALLAVAGCSGSNDLDEPPVAMGDFLLGHTIVVADDVQSIGPSRTATPDEWKAVLTDQLKQRFSRYDGDKYYHIAVAVDGYALAVPGIPLVLSPKSALVVSATIWDDAAGAKLNAEPKQFTILEDLSGETVIGSGLTAWNAWRLAAANQTLQQTVRRLNRANAGEQAARAQA